MRKPAKFVTTDPPAGTTRILRSFAWRRKVIAGTIIWLEYFETWQVFAYFEYPVLIEGKTKIVKIGKWKDLEDRLRIK